MQLELNFDADPVTLEIEQMIGEQVEKKREYRVYRSREDEIHYLYVLTETKLYDISLSITSKYNKIFIEYDRENIKNAIQKVFRE